MLGNARRYMWNNLHINISSLPNGDHTSSHDAALRLLVVVVGGGGRSRRSGTGDGVFLRRNSNNVSRHILLEIFIGAVYVAAPARYVTAHFPLIYIPPNLVGSWLVVVGEG